MLVVPQSRRAFGGASNGQLIRPASDMVGQSYTSDELADLLNKQADILRGGEGGVTFSGGEPLAQAAFVAEVIQKLEGLHVTLDTSGFGSPSDFQLLAGLSNLVLFDLKLMNPEKHRQYTGQDNGPILRNLDLLANLPTPCVIRVPLNSRRDRHGRESERDRRSGPMSAQFARRGTAAV